MRDTTLGLTLNGFMTRPRQSLMARALSAIRRLGGTLIGIPDNALGDGAPNLLGSPEFAGGVTDAPTRGGLVTASTLAGYDGAIAFGHDGTTVSYAYKAFTPTVGLTYTLSVIVKMDDGNAPSFGSITAGSPLNTFALILRSDAVSQPTYFVENLGGGVFRVSYFRLMPDSAAGSNWGVVKYSTNDARTFRVTGYKLELGSVATAYTSQSVLRQRGIFTDSTGITPVTAVGDVIGKLNDRVGTNNATQPTTASKPVVTRVPKRLGPNLVVNGTFDSGTTGWFATNGGTVSVSGGELVVTNAIASSGRGYQMVPTEVGKPYLITSFARAGTASAIVGWGTLAGSSAGGSVLTSSAQPLQLAFVATAASTSVTLQTNTATAGHTASFDNIEVREVLEWTNAISFDGSNDFLQTGITTGNEGWICAGVTPANTTSAMSVANAGEGTVTIPGVWLFSSGGSWTASASDGSFRTNQAAAMQGASPQFVSMGWNASSLALGVNGTELTTPKIGTGSWSSVANVLRFGLYQGSSIPFNGPMTAIIYTPVLPNALDRALIRKWVGSLQGQTL